MTKIFIAQFENGKPKLYKAEIVKETEKSIMVKDGKGIINGYYLPARIDKSKYFTSTNPVEVLGWLQSKCNDYTTKLTKEIAKSEEWNLKLSELLVKITEDENVT